MELSTAEKALAINLNRSIYGSIAEIGAGQEVARWFFSVGAAAATMAKSMSAYDMTFSDKIYGVEESGRYVVEGRVNKMLDHEYSLLVERLGEERGDQSRFFAFANSVAAKGYKRTQNWHGWVGLRFQHEVDSDPNNIILHVKMLEPSNSQQQEALGILGVNLIYAAYFKYNEPAKIVSSLLDNLNRTRIEIDLIKFSGPAFKNCDQRMMNLFLIDSGLADSIFFNASGNVELPGDVFYDKSLLVQRGTFCPFTITHEDMLKKGEELFREKTGIKDYSICCEMTLEQIQIQNKLLSQNMLDRLEVLNELGYPVFITNFRQYNRLHRYLKTLTHKHIGFIIGVNQLHELYEEDRYIQHRGGVLGALGDLFHGHSLLLSYPAHHGFFENPESPSPKKSTQLVTAENLQLGNGLRLLHQYLFEKGLLLDIKDVTEKYLNVYSRGLFKLIGTHQSGWEEFVPHKVEELIKERGLFGWESR